MNVDPQRQKKDLPHLVDALSAARGLPPAAAEKTLSDRRVLLADESGLRAAIAVQSLAFKSIGAEAGGSQPGVITSAIFRTGSGNVYEVSRLPDGGLRVASARNRRTVVISGSGALAREARIGQPLEIGEKKTAPVSQIFAVRSSPKSLGSFDLASTTKVAIRTCGGEVSFVQLLQKEQLQASAVPDLSAPVRPERSRRPVLVTSGRSVCLALDGVGLDLRMLLAPAQDEPSEVLEIFLRTESGNIYGLLRNRADAIVALNARAGLGEPIGRKLLEQGRVEVGERFVLGDSIVTSKISQIVAIFKVRKLPKLPTLNELRDLSLDIAAGNMSFIRHELIEACCARMGKGRLKEIIRSNKPQQ